MFGATRNDSSVQRHNPYSSRLTQLQASSSRAALIPTEDAEQPVGAVSSSRLILRELMDELRKSRHEITALQKESKGVISSVHKLVEETKKLTQEVQKLKEHSFTIKGSELQVRMPCINMHTLCHAICVSTLYNTLQSVLNVEAAKAFCSDMGRQLSTKKMEVSHI